MRLLPAAAWVALLAVPPCLLPLVPSAHARTLVPVQSFGGQMPLDVPPLVKSPITSRADLERAWATCRVKASMPAVDFRRYIVLAAVAQSSKVSFVGLDLDHGNLKTNVVIAPDMPKHRTCSFAIVDRTGIGSVNGIVVGK